MFTNYTVLRGAKNSTSCKNCNFSSAYNDYTRNTIMFICLTRRVKSLKYKFSIALGRRVGRDRNVILLFRFDFSRYQLYVDMVACKLLSTRFVFFFNYYRYVLNINTCQDNLTALCWHIDFNSKIIFIEKQCFSAMKCFRLIVFIKPRYV